jgi:diacylglycerol kinase (ATP)
MPLEPILFLVNSKAGHGLPRNFESEIKSVFKTTGMKFEIIYSEYAGHMEELAEKGIDDGFKTIVVAGGDGSVNEVFKKIIGFDVNFGILPIGSGNGLARHLKIPLKFKNALKVILTAKIQKIDSAEINNIPYLSIAGTGFDALIAKHFAESKSRGFWNYFKLTVKHYFSYKPIDYLISANDEKIRSKALLISFANSNQFGYNISIAPQAILNDGYLDICIVEKPSFFMLPITAYYLLSGRIYKSKYCRTFRTKKLDLSCDDDSMINIDGEFYQASKKIKVKILPNSINVIVP